MKKFAFICFIIISSFCCNNGSSPRASQKTDRLPVKASINLRLGQVSRLDSPVAISAAIENGEAMVIFDRNQNTNLLDVLYRNSNAKTLLVSFDKTGRPVSAQAQDAVIAFRNYTATTVDITLSTGETSSSESKKTSSSRTFPNLPIDSKSIDFLNSDIMLRILLGLDSDSSAKTRGILAPAFSSLKIVGCLSQDVISQFQTLESFNSEIFDSITGDACQSALLDSISEIFEKTNYENITATGLSTPSDCFSNFNFSSANNCASTIAAENIEAAQTGIVNEFPRPTEKPNSSATQEISPSPQPTGSIPEIVPTPTLAPNSVNLGIWTGNAKGSTGQTGCRDFEINFSVTINGSNECRPPSPCNLVGTFNDVADNFLNFGISGTVDNIGHFEFSGSTDIGNGPTNLIADGNFNAQGTDGIGLFTNTLGSCTGTITLIRQNFRP